jgi:hypothetical protein
MKKEGVVMTFIKNYIEWWRKRFFLALTIKFFAGLVIGFGLGVYFLPIIVADAPVTASVIQEDIVQAELQAEFVRDLPGSDFSHWGEGTLYLSPGKVTLDGEVSPGPDYRLYLTPKFVDSKAGFLEIKDQSLQVVRIKGFENFAYPIDDNIDFSRYDSVVIWCERFSMFITAGRLKPL